MTARIYPGPDATGISAFSVGPCMQIELCKWNLEFNI